MKAKKHNFKANGLTAKFPQEYVT